MRVPLLLTAATGLIAASLAFAHVDDPKAYNIAPTYKGSGWRAGDRAPQRRASPEAGSLGFSAHNMVLRSHVSLSEIGDTNPANDCWGYVSPSGREYALFGFNTGTAVVEVTDPDSADHLMNLAGPQSIWRDIKTYSHFAYVVSEGGSHIQVFDLANIDGGVVMPLGSATDPGPSSTHNVAINTDSGRLYRCGGGGRGIRIYSLANPSAPVFVGEWSTRYVHDAQVVTMASGPYAGHEIAFCCSGYNSGWVETGLDVLDVTNPGAIVELGRIIYPGGVYSHQGWLTEDRRFFLLGDELDEDGSLPTTTHLINVEDLTDPTYAGNFDNGLMSVGHNMYTLGDLVFQSNYSSGLRVFDVTDPQSGSEVAWFDTYPPDNNPSYNGSWSNYPYLPSGNIIVSDRQYGLFVVSLDLPSPEDLNGDDLVDFDDLLLLLTAWGPCPAPPAGCSPDIDGDGTVGFQDLLALLAAWTT